MLNVKHGKGFQHRDLFNVSGLHELVHWSGGKKRLGREMKGKFGSADYAEEELVFVQRLRRRFPFRVWCRKWLLFHAHPCEPVHLLPVPVCRSSSVNR
ncbi:zincin-like metallopeptidase domain-containing protein [Escherichia coli]|uniref:zincin-like metallopeptidase domain-containing protein n=1 Tax=Escherichia coli TaxID=562 RepID=UPI003F5189EF